MGMSIVTEMDLKENWKCTYCRKRFQLGDKIYWYRPRGYTQKLCDSCAGIVRRRWEAGGFSEKTVKQLIQEKDVAELI